MFTRCVLLLASLLSSVVALPLLPRDVVDPPITSPTAGTIWYVGQTQTVTWNATGLPVNQTNPVGKLVLGYQFNNSENLMLDSPLATNLNYAAGQAEITIPNVPTRTDYIIVLFGDSGNASPEFTITNIASSSSTPVPSSSVSTDLPSSTPNRPRATVLSSSSTRTRAPSMSSTVIPSSATSSRSSTTAKASSTLPATQSSIAWRNHAPILGTCLIVVLTTIYFDFS